MKKTGSHLAPPTQYPPQLGVPISFLKNNNNTHNNTPQPLYWNHCPSSSIMSGSKQRKDSHKKQKATRKELYKAKRAKLAPPPAIITQTDDYVPSKGFSSPQSAKHTVGTPIRSPTSKRRSKHSNNYEVIVRRTSRAQSSAKVKINPSTVLPWLRDDFVLPQGRKLPLPSHIK